MYIFKVIFHVCLISFDQRRLVRRQKTSIYDGEKHYVYVHVCMWEKTAEDFLPCKMNKTIYSIISHFVKEQIVLTWPTMSDVDLKFERH